MEVYCLDNLRNVDRKKLPSLKILEDTAYHALNKEEALFIMSLHKWRPLIFGGFLRDYYSNDDFPLRDRIKGDIDIVLGCQYLTSQEGFFNAMDVHFQPILSRGGTRIDINKYGGIRVNLYDKEPQEFRSFDVWPFLLSTFMTDSLKEKLSSYKFAHIRPELSLLAGATFTCEAICYDVFERTLYCIDNYFQMLDSYIDFNNEEDYQMVREVFDNILAESVMGFHYGAAKERLKRTKKLYSKLERYVMDGFELKRSERVVKLMEDWQLVEKLMEKHHL